MTRHKISRRDFLKIAGLAALAYLPPRRPGWQSNPPIAWPSLSQEQFPAELLRLLQAIPAAEINTDGYLNLLAPAAGSPGLAPTAQTEWNRENSFPNDRLYPETSWGIVLHWYSDNDHFDHSLAGYLRGFDSLRPIANYLTRTSAHFLVGTAAPLTALPEGEEPFGILQTQLPDTDGTPFVASHLLQLDLQAHKDRLQYFVRAYYQMAFQQPTVHSLLQDMYDGRRMDPNMRTLAVEITGHDFDQPAYRPPMQQVANVLAVVRAIMQRYRIPASGLLGHHEIQLGKPDPGKQFMALVRLLLGAWALADNDQDFKELVFGQHLDENQDAWQAVRIYFSSLRTYLVLVSRPAQVYEWEKTSQFWAFYDLLDPNRPNPGLASEYFHPLPGAESLPDSTFILPANHEGIDLTPTAEAAAGTQTVRLVARGVCLFTGISRGYHQGHTAIFRHRQLDGAETLSIYGNLSSLGALQPGRAYEAGHPIGEVTWEPAHPKPLHFAIAYGATWETDLSINADLPLNIGPTWIRQRYMHPQPYLNGSSVPAQPVQHTRRDPR